ncbi:MAG: cheD [Phenylobacterium sp.]|nr:cheD [Phenylobacterium sp.]
MTRMGSNPRVDGPRPVHIVQGEHHVTNDPEVVLTTILGSCVAACVRDPLTGVGGMNHFLLPGDDRHKGDPDSVRYGVHAMELLVNALLSRGARRERLEVKLFGGARLITGLTDVGELNATFAEDFLRREGLSHVGGSLRGDCGRRIQYWPVNGRARQVFLTKETPEVFARETQRVPKPAADTGALELF